MTNGSDHKRMQLIVSQVNAGKLAEAALEATLIGDKTLACEAWRLLSRVNANTQRFDNARLAIENALHNQPDSRAVRFERALVMEQQGQYADALHELESLAGGATDTPQLLVHLARGLQFAGRTREAEEKLEAALRRWPTDMKLHAQLAQLRWRSGDAQAAALGVEQAIERFPQEPGLRLVAADLLRNTGDADKALALLEGGLAFVPDSPIFLTSIGVLLDDLGRPGEALRFHETALARAPDSLQAKRNLLATRLRLGEGAEALRVVDELLPHARDDQQLIAYRAMALRLLGDSGYGKLHDYARLVRAYRLEPPARFGQLARFNTEFARELAQLHRSEQRPLSQSVRGGSQTERNLPAGNPCVAAFVAMIDAPIRDYIARLRDDNDHPTDRRKSAAYRLAGSWSVALQPGGFHLNHVHPQGWLSSAYYVELPGAIADERMRAGWLKFGEPGLPIAGCGPDHFVKPEPGLLVLFPSYMFHGTVPFTEGGRRLTAAFDVVPD